MSESNNNSSRTEHYANKISFIHQCIEDGSIKLKFVNSEENVADALTKLLPKQKLAKHRQTLHHGHDEQAPPSLSRTEYKLTQAKEKRQKRRGGSGSSEEDSRK